MQESMEPDYNIQRICQRISNEWRCPITLDMRADVMKYFGEYVQIEHDSPNLIWLYALIRESGIQIQATEPIAAMKRRLLEEEVLTPMAWRYIANGTAEDFRIVLDSFDPEGMPGWRWKILVYWLQILSALRRKTPLPEPLQGLFYNDSLIVIPEDGVVDFRGAWISFGTLRHILKEAELRLSKGTLDLFAQTELIEVITWLAATERELDSNQIKRGWQYLAEKAAEWMADVIRQKACQKLKWVSELETVQILHWMIEPVTDAWTLSRLAIVQRHCATRFIEGCIAGTERIFAIKDDAGKTAATLRLTRNNRNWSIGDIRGFANAEVSKELHELGVEIFHRYAELWSRKCQDHRRLSLSPKGEKTMIEKAEGIFAGLTDIAKVHLVIGEGGSLNHKANCLRLSADTAPPNFNAEELVAQMHTRVHSNIRKRLGRPDTGRPSDANWDFMRRMELDPKTGSEHNPEVTLERAVVQARRSLPHQADDLWTYQMPVATMHGSRANKSSNIDLVRKRSGSAFDLIELKVGSNNPVFAAVEILQYGLAYAASRQLAKEIGYDTNKLEILGAREVSLEVWAPKPFYDKRYKLAWLEEGLNTALNQFSKNLDYEMSFKFRVLNLEWSPTDKPTREALEKINEAIDCIAPVAWGNTPPQ